MLRFYYAIGSQEDTCGSDKGAVLVSGTVVESIDLCRGAMAGKWLSHQVDLGAYAGQTVTLGFRATLDGVRNSNFFIDLVSLGAAAASSGSSSGTDSEVRGPLPADISDMKP
jgi:hypothetical protein